MIRQRLNYKYLFTTLMSILLITVMGLTACATPTSVPATRKTPESTPLSADVQPPNSPSNLIGESVSQNIVSLHWSDNSRNEDGFRIYRNGTVIATTNANNTACQDTALEAGRIYQYAVKAYNTAGESGPCLFTVKMPNPPLNVTINHIGVKFDHDPAPIYPEGDIRLVLVVSDGNQTLQEIIPPGEGSYQLNDYETMELNQRIFHTASAGDYLKIVIVAYEDDQETLISDILQAALPMLGPIIGLPDVGGISAIFSAYEENTGKPLFENKDDYVGYFEGLWSSDESWGIGQHNAVGTEDFRVWLSIWSDTQPQPVPKPMLVPDVAIENVQMVSQVEVNKHHTTTITLENNESHSIQVTLKTYSSVTGEFFSKSLIIRANDEAEVTHSAYCETPGERTITYKLFYQGNEIDSWQGTLVAITPSVKKALSVTFDGWYVNSSEVTTANKDDAVFARITLTDGHSGQYTICIKRDIRWASDTIVNEVAFSYNGVSLTKEISFTPPYVTDEASTDGYFIVLVKDGYEVWGLVNAYPPRLRVTIP